MLLVLLMKKGFIVLTISALLLLFTMGCTEQQMLFIKQDLNTLADLNFGNIEVNGNLLLHGDLNVDGNQYTYHNIDINQDLNVHGTFYLQDQNIDQRFIRTDGSSTTTASIPHVFGASFGSTGQSYFDLNGNLFINYSADATTRAITIEDNASSIQYPTFKIIDQGLETVKIYSHGNIVLADYLAVESQAGNGDLILLNRLGDTTYAFKMSESQTFVRTAESVNTDWQWKDLGLNTVAQITRDGNIHANKYCFPDSSCMTTAPAGFPADFNFQYVSWIDGNATYMKKTDMNSQYVTIASTQTITGDKNLSGKTTIMDANIRNAWFGSGAAKTIFVSGATGTNKTLTGPNANTTLAGTGNFAQNFLGGLIFSNNSQAQFTGTGGVAITGNQNFDSNFYGNQLFADMNMDFAGIKITIGAINQYYPLDSGLGNSLVRNNGFQLRDNNRLEADGDGKYLFVYSTSISTGDNNSASSCVLRNLVCQKNTISRVFSPVAGKNVVTSGTGIIDIRRNDMIEIGFANHSSTENITVDNVNFTILRVGN